MSVSEPSPKQQIANISDYHKIELEEIFVTTRTLISLRIQIFSFLGTANLTMLGFAFTAQKDILIFLASSLMFLLIAIDSTLRPISDVLFARGLQIEKIYSNNDHEALCTSIISASVSDKRKSHRLISEIQEAQTQDEIIRLIKSRSSNQLGVWIPLQVLIIDCILGLILWKLNLLPLF